jgi:DNA-binding NtrC family response regulator
LVCATHKNLEQLVQSGDFREDLYYRINVFSIEIPPLRERTQDIQPLARHFIAAYARAMGKPVRSLSPEALQLLEGYRWPGNVRELENAIERAMVIGKGTTIEPEDLPLRAGPGENQVSDRSLADMERVHIERVLEELDGNITQAAKVLGIDRATLYNKLKRYGIRR